MLNLTEISILKSRAGVYQDTPENRRLHRVGMKYGAEKKQDSSEPKDPKSLLDKIFSAINEWDDKDFMDEKKNDAIAAKISEIIDKYKISEKDFQAVARKYPALDMVYSDYKRGDDKPSWDKIEAFYKKGSDENALWDAWYRYQKTGDPSNMSKFRQILENKFPKVSSWKQTAPNTGKAEISAMDKGGEVIATIDLGGNTVSLSKLHMFMDKCYKA